MFFMELLVVKGWNLRQVYNWGCLKVGVPQSFVLYTKKQGPGALLGTPILRHPQFHAPSRYHSGAQD